MMTENPYKYTGALDPVKDQLVCIPRTGDIKRVIAGVKNGVYWNILGSRQVGKSTFLRQIQNRLRDAYCLYFTLESSPEEIKNFYQWLMDKIRDEIPTRKRRIKINKNLEPKQRFLDFLERFEPREDKKIILLFDEIEGTTFLKNFLDIWRTVHEDRYNKKQLERYAVITAGSTNLVEATTGPTSPYNVAEDLYLKDFSYQESEDLIKKPFEKLGIKIAPESDTYNELISQLSGHPQMLQHACSKLVDIALGQEKSVSKKNVTDVLYSLTKENTTISILKKDLEKEEKLRKLAASILKGEATSFSQNQRFAIAGAGCIQEDENQQCTIRNQVFKRAIEFILVDLGIIEPPVPTRKESKFPYIPTNKYRIIEKIGEGGMGSVYKAMDEPLARLVAVKVLNPELAQYKKIRDKFYREAQITAQLQHPKIVTIYEVMKLENAIIMEFIQGKTLLEQLSIYKTFPYLHVFYVVKELLEALDHAHNNHNTPIIHRDVKPGNIMINIRGEIKVLDFGLAAVQDVFTKEETRPVIGNPHYMSPEQARGEPVDERSDIYSCGATMFHLLTGQYPFKSGIIDDRKLVNSMKYEVKQDIPDEVIEIIAECMKEKKRDRFQNARELLDEIKEIEITLLKRPTTKDDIKDIIPGAA